jgi:hypothetical protein
MMNPMMMGGYGGGMMNPMMMGGYGGMMNPMMMGGYGGMMNPMMMGGYGGMMNPMMMGGYGGGMIDPYYSRMLTGSLIPPVATPPILPPPPDVPYHDSLPNAILGNLHDNFQALPAPRGWRNKNLPEASGYYPPGLWA